MMIYQKPSFPYLPTELTQEQVEKLETKARRYKRAVELDDSNRDVRNGAITSAWNYLESKAGAKLWKYWTRPIDAFLFGLGIGLIGGSAFTFVVGINQGWFR